MPLQKENDPAIERRLQAIYAHLPSDALRHSRSMLSQKEQLRQIITLVNNCQAECKIRFSNESYDDYCGRVLNEVLRRN